MVSAQLPTAFARPVSLQRLSGSRWVTVKKGKTSSSGKATLTMASTASSVQVRIDVPKFKRKGKTYKTRRTATRRVTLRAQSVSFTMTQTATPAAPITVRAVAAPARSGRAVSLQRQAGATWTTISTGTQSGTGAVTFGATPAAADADGVSYRVLVGARQGAPAVTSPARTFRKTTATMTPTVVADRTPDGKVTLAATTTGAVTKVRFFVDGRKLTDDTSAPWSVPWTPERGTHHVMARAIGPDASALSAVEELVVPGAEVDDEAGLPEGFAIDTVQEGFDLPTSFAMASTGQVFVSQKGGKVMAFGRDSEGSWTTPRTVIDISEHVHQNEDRGLIGIAVDPRFADGDGHQWVYVSYIYRDPDNVVDGRLDEVQQVQRFDISAWSGESGDALGYDADNVVLGRTTGPACYDEQNIRTPDCVPIHGSSHSIGELQFDADGNLLVGVGDGSLFYTADGLNGRTQSLRAQDIDVLAGKVLRIDPDTGRGVPGNPYYGVSGHDGASVATHGTSNASRVLAMGFRNPFRFSVLANGHIMVGDVGDAATEEIDVVDPDDAAPRNYGWPCYEGDERTDVSVGTGTPDPSTNPWDTCRLLWARDDAVTGPVHSYPHVNGGSVTGGVVYTGDAYPAEYQGAYFFGDYAQNFIRTARIDDHGNVGSVEPFAYRSAAAGPVKFAMGPDGTLWYLSIYTGSLRRIVYDATPTPDTCAVGSFTTRYYDLDDPASSLANSTDDYPAGWGWLRFADATFPAAAVAAEPGCAAGIHLAPTSAAVRGGVPADRFGIRWQGRVRLDAGTYEFDVKGRDWVRVWVDDVAVHEWFAYGGWLPRTETVTVPAGLHNIRVELVNDVGEASADVTWTRKGAPPTAAVTGPANGTVLPGALVAGVQSGSLSYGVHASGDADLRSLTVLADLLHVTDDGVHLHPYAEKTFALTGRGQDVTGTFALKDSHAPQHSVFRVRARVEDVNGALTTSSPTYVCLTGNGVGPCATK
ncbi:MAG: hypothetical protein JWP56_2826 [Aeromicrobium sp.]|nr:hypothetical protein [Aeromicrobium sp.]